MSLLLLFRPKGEDAQVIIGGDDGGDAIGPRPRSIRKGIPLTLVPDEIESTKPKKRTFIVPAEIKVKAFEVFAKDKAEEILEKLSRQVVDKYAKNDLESQIIVKESAIFKLWVQVKKEQIVLLMFAMGGFDE